MDDLRAELGDFDPSVPLAAAPEPWAAQPTPAARPGPPFAMTEMIAAQPALAARIAGRLVTDGSASALAAALRENAAHGGSVVVTGCGTSEHAALAIVEVLRDAWRAAGLTGPAPTSAQAFELSLDPPAGGLVIGVSHEGGTAATIAALEVARGRGARTALITASRGAPAVASADIVLETLELDASWCHTVGYTSPIIAGCVVAGLLRRTPADPARLRDRLAAGIEAAHRSEPSGNRADEVIASAFAEATSLLVIASGTDRPAARELVLKVEEATWLPSASRNLETFLHGHLPATGESSALVLLLTDPEARPERVARARQALAAARVIGIRTAAIVTSDVSDSLPADLTAAGRVVLPEAPELPGPVASLLGTATALQLVTERLARARGTNPDPIRRDDPRYAHAAEVADAPIA